MSAHWPEGQRQLAKTLYVIVSPTFLKINSAIRGGLVRGYYV